MTSCLRRINYSDLLVIASQPFGQAGEARSAGMHVH
jgi:hypothetical protein